MSKTELWGIIQEIMVVMGFLLAGCLLVKLFIILIPCLAKFLN